MPEARKRPCRICRRWFRPKPRVGDRQRACGKPDCQTARRQKTQENWRARNGHKRIAALRQLKRDTVEATVWPMSQAEALLLSRSLRFSPQESALEQGWLLSEMEQRFSYPLDELARRFDRSTDQRRRRMAVLSVG